MPAEKEEEVTDDVPAWFMTFSDVITLLMTFFILLLTFSTTEPERFEQITASVFGSDGSTGHIGTEQLMMDRDSWSTRVRPRAARIAIQGSEMPPIVKEYAGGPSGEGIAGPSEEAEKKDVVKTYSFELPIDRLINQNLQPTRKGIQALSSLAKQLDSLELHCALEVSDKTGSGKVSALADYLYHNLNVRPGQVGIGFVPDVNSGSLRIVFEKYEPQR
ncbi:flagellar motor protein MotB [Stieleria bergensis]|uniref:Flagellar motor protein MotB n=1 Tax=Stieleria bergensis TaxID=2528025 RepID=A0A517STT0_9BACT|nr:MAG: hypothetical protein CBB71_03165 [Rhodopirellula sp. TMED11]QDT59527.1 flagellar motor protein MotB [Planctomycetes bacterium SV_7m_r]